MASRNFTWYAALFCLALLYGCKKTEVSLPWNFEIDNGVEYINFKAEDFDPLRYSDNATIDVKQNYFVNNLDTSAFSNSISFLTSELAIGQYMKVELTTFIADSNLVKTILPSNPSTARLNSLRQIITTNTFTSSSAKSILLASYVGRDGQKRRTKLPGTANMDVNTLIIESAVPSSKYINALEIKFKYNFTTYVVNNSPSGTTYSSPINLKGSATTLFRL